MTNIKKSKFRKILVCVDQSKPSEKALTKAIWIAKRFQSEIILIHVIDERYIDFWNDTEFMAQSLTPQVNLKKDSEVWQKAKKLLEKYQKMAQKNKVRCKIVVQIGNVANKILNLSKRNKVDLIIMGARGVSGVKKFLLGSNSSKISENANCSVLIVR